MKMEAYALCFLLIATAAPIHCQGSNREPSNNMMIFVFGDSFADVGGRPRTSERTLMSRSWFFPYGISDTAHRRRATGRASDGLIQADILAKILGRDESPLPYSVQMGDDRLDGSGVNFAISGSGVLDAEGSTSLRRQVDELTSMVDNGFIDEQSLSNSVALVAICAGHDYPSITHNSTYEVMRALSEHVTDEIAASVMRLQDVGVGKVLVNLMPPIGCNPWQSAANNYSRCDDHGNMLASVRALRDKLDGSQHVLLLNLYTVFNSLEIDDLAPCCLNLDPDSYCGELDAHGRQKYTLCDMPENFFFWDYLHPTQSAWEDIMERFVGPIEDFLEIESSW